MYSPRSYPTHPACFVASLEMSRTSRCEGARIEIPLACDTKSARRYTHAEDSLKTSHGGKKKELKRNKRKKDKQIPKYYIFC